MGKKKLEYYDKKPLLALEAEYNIIMGERSNGKTYAALETGIEDFLSGKGFITYVRRYSDEIKPAYMKMLFAPFDIEKMSKKKYNKISFRGQQFDIGLYDEEKRKWLTRETLCYTVAINTWENAKGADRGKCANVVFDEFMTRRFYLTNEFTLFQNVISSFIRDRGDARIWLIGNTVNFYSPYFDEFELENVKEMKPGDLNCYTFDNGTKIAVEYCQSVGEEKNSAKYFNFNSKKPNMITTGKWEIPDYPHYIKSIDFIREVKCRFYIIFDNNTLCLNIVSKPNEVFVYVHEQTKEIDLDKCLTFSTEYSGDPRHCTTFRQGTTNVHKILNNLISMGRLFFSSNKVGEMFNNYYKWQQKYSIVK